MLQPKPKFTPPSDAVVVEPKSNFVPPSDAIVLKKKESTELPSTTPMENTESVQKVGSLDGVGSNGFPAIDVNLGVPGLKPELKTVEQLANPPKSKQSEVKTPEKRGFASEVFHKLATGSSQLGVDIAAIPELLYDTFSVPQNAIADYFDLPNLRTDSEKFKKTIGVKNAVKELYQDEVKKLREQSALVDEKYKYGIYDSFKNGDVEGGLRQLTNSFAESLPATTAIMLGGAYTKAPQLLATSTMMFGAGKNEQLKEENPEMSTNARVANALGTGFAEGAFETMGSGSIGAAAKGLVEKEGVKKGAQILKDGLVDFYKSALAKSPFTASIVGEGVEEWATQVTQNAIDVATGAKPQDFNIFDGATDAFIGGSFGGSVFGAGLKGLEKIANNEDKVAIKSNLKKTFELQKALENPNISEESKAEIHKTIDGLVKTNQKLVEKNVDFADNLDPKLKEKLATADSKIDEIKNKIKAIKLDGNTTDTQKQILLDGLKEDFEKNTALKTDILNGMATVVDALPLKEQDKLKRQALKELTAEQNPDGTKNIEIDNAQIVERANKIYLKENEKPQEVAVTEQIVETQPQAEVPQQAEAEKVAELRDSTKITQNQEVSPVEDVVAPSVEKKTIQQLESENKTTLPKIPSDKIFKNEVVPLTQNQTKGIDEFIEQKKENNLPIQKVDVGLIVPTQKTVNVNNLEKTSKITEKTKITEPILLVKENGKYFVVDGHHRISNEILNGNTTVEAKVFDNEATPPTNTPANGNVQSRTSDVGESGITEQESPAKESVPSAVKSESSQVANEVNLDDITNFINQTYLSDEKTSAKTETDQRAIEDSNKENREIPIVGKRKKQVKLTKEGKVSLQGRKSLSKRKFKGDRKTASEIDPTDAQSLALNYFVTGGKISSDYFKSKGERQARNNGINGIASAKAKNIDGIAHDIWESQENSGLKFDTEDIKAAIEEVVNGNLTVQDVVNTMLKNYGLEKEDSVDYEKNYFNAIQEYQQEEDYSQEHIQEVESALDYLSDAEIIELANNQEKEFEDYIKDLESRQVTYDLGAFSERGTIQPDGWILSENGELLSPQSVRNVKQINLIKKKSVVFNIDGKQEFYHASENKRNGRLQANNAPQFGTGIYFSTNKEKVENEYGDKNTTTVKLNIEKPVYTNTKQWNEVQSLAIEKADKDYGEKKGLKLDEDETYFRYDKDNFSEIDEIPSKFISDAAKELGYDAIIDKGSIDYENEVVVLDESKIIYPEDEVNDEKTKTSISKESPELKEINTKIEKANENLRIAKDALDRKAKSLDKELLKDAEDLFGARKSQSENKLFDERVDADARNKATEKERKAISDAQNEIKSLKETKAKIESGEIVSTSEMDFDKNESAYKFTDTPALIDAKAINGSELPITAKATENIIKNEGSWNKALKGDVKNLGNGWFEVGKTTKGESILYAPETDKAVTIIDAKNKGGRNSIYVRDFVENNPQISKSEQLKQKVDAEVDKYAQKVKDILPGIKDPDLKRQGISQDDLIDLVASAVKALVSKGIDINDAIRQVIASIKERFNVDVDEKLVKEKLGVEKPQDFESKAGKKSVLNRMASGNSSVIKKAIAKYSLDYEIENQKEAKLKAEMFVDEVGVDNALIAVRKGLIDGAQGAFIYARTIEVLEQQINDLKGDDKLDAIADYQELLGQISDELDNRSRSNGRFIAALAEIYNSSNGRYNLKKMVNDYKAANNGTISKEVLEKLKNVEEKLKESEAKLAELEAKKRVEEENEAFNNILEAVARKKRINTNAKISDKQKAKAFADKLRSFKISNNTNLSAATPFSIAYDLAIETAAKAIEVSGLVSDAIKAGVNSIRNSKLSKDEQEQALSDLFDLFDDSELSKNQKGIMSIDLEGKLRIPHSLIREKVENGIDNIDDLVSELMSDAQELFPDLDFTERQVRDIVTGYGKVSNPTTDEIETQISIMKSLGKIASGLEDAYKGQRPLRSGQQRREPTVKERTEMKKLKALLRDLPLADADIKKAYKTALEAIKKRLSNEIEELDEQIANGEKRKGQKSVIEYDQEAKDLKAERDAKKSILDEMVGKPELTEQQKIDRAEKTLQKRLDDLQQKIDNSEIDYAKKAESVTSAKLEEMRKLKKELESQIQKMREDSGLAEARLIDIAKRNASKRLAALKERIANGDFEKRKRKPTPTDVELNKIKSEIAQQKEIFDKEVYKLELKNRRIEQKALDVLKDILSIPKILSFTADLSFVGIQNVTQIYKMGANSLIHLAKTGKLKGTFRDAMAKTFKAMASPDFEQKFMQAVKANPNYQLWKDSKLGIVESHYKESAKAEVFQHNALSTLFDILGNYVASKGYGKAGDIIKNYVNIISIFERGQTVFENQMRINRFQEGVDLLKAQGLNPIDDIQEYRKVAAAVNTLTGRANTGSKVAAALREANGTLFSSFSNWAAGVNQLNPYWYYTLTPTARKMALTDVAHHIVGAGALISLAALYGLGQDDDDDDDKVVVVPNPTSSDFAVIKVGNLRIDPWAGKKTTVVAISRFFKGGKTDKYGNFKKYGVEYDDEDWIDLPLEYAGNKIAPGPRFALERFFKTKEVEYQGSKFREDKYGTDFKASKYLIPLIFENFKEVNEEQPNLFGKAAMALSWTGLINTNVYGGMKEGFKDMPDDLIEKEYKVKIQKIKDNEKILESNIDKLAKEYNEKKITKNQILQKVDSLVNGDGELFNKSIKSIIEKVNKEELKTLVDDPFYLGLKKEKNPEIQAILFYSKFKDDSGMSYKEKKERDRNLRYIEFDAGNPRFIKAYRELLNSKKKPVN